MTSAPLRMHPAVRWLPWNRAAFERARDEDRIILLSIAAAWSGACRQMDEECFGDRAIAEEINRWFVPVRVDADRRPDVADRYDLGGLPTTAFLTSNGEVLGGGTFVPRERLRPALQRVRDVGTGALAPTPHDQRATPRKPESIDLLIERVFDCFDPVHAGFGDAPKFPLVAPVRLAVELSGETQSAAIRDYAARTLDAMGWQGLYDHDAGGFFRCCLGADWQNPQREKLLVTNAGLLDLYLGAGVALETERWLGRAADVLEYVQLRLTSGAGDGWKASEESDGARLADANALMAAAALHASRVFDDSSLGQLALDALESVLLSTYRPGQGVAHCQGGVRGLLTDQISMAGAQLDAWEYTDNVVYLMMAQELAHHAINALWDAEHGGFFDRASSVDEELGIPERRLKPFALNCEAAIVLHRLSGAAEDPEFDRLASATLDAVATGAPGLGPLAAHYVLARRSLSG